MWLLWSWQPRTRSHTTAMRSHLAQQDNDAQRCMQRVSDPATKKGVRGGGWARYCIWCSVLPQARSVCLWSLMTGRSSWKPLSAGAWRTRSLFSTLDNYQVDRASLLSLITKPNRWRVSLTPSTLKFGSCSILSTMCTVIGTVIGTSLELPKDWSRVCACPD